eukprot:14901943-Alexandrium_andersonii.AAC.1
MLQLGQPGGAEASNRRLREMARALRVDAQKRYDVPLTPISAVFPWLTRHAAWLLPRFAPRGTARQTAHYVLDGCQYTHPIRAFGETVLFRYPESSKAHNKFGAKWAKG